MAIGDGVSAIATLAVTFGGFSPTAMDGVTASKEQLERMEIEYKRKQAEAKRLRDLEYARSSKPYTYSCGDKTVWTYRIVDQSMVRITRCRTAEETLEIPSSIEGLPVYAISADACAELRSVRQIICPDSVKTIGLCAFRMNENLEYVRFPKDVVEFSATWLSQCPKIKTIVLPGMLEKITGEVFENPSLQTLIIGKNVKNVLPGAFEKTQLKVIEVAADNPFIDCDGDALYAKDGKTLIALARPVKKLIIQNGCKRVAKKACMGVLKLEQVVMPDSLEVLEDYAFAHTGLKRLECGCSLKTIGERSFFHCKELSHVTLNAGLESIAAYAFAGSGLEGIVVPASVRFIGNCIVQNTNVVYTGEGATFAVSSQNPLYFYDGNGGLYKQDGEYLRFVQLIDPTVAAFKIVDGTHVVESYAFAFHETIEEVEVPEGVEQIGDSAFRVCRKLRSVTFPSTLRAIGKEAFIDSSLTELFIPAALQSIGADAFVTAGAHRLVEPPSIAKISADPANTRFYVESGILCERGEDGDRAILFDNSVEDVAIPERVKHIESYAFSNCRNIKSIYLGPNLKTIGSSGLLTWSFIEHIKVELKKPLEGRTVFEFRFPDTARSIHEISLALGGSSWVNVPDMMKHFDNCLANAHDYTARKGDGVTAYEQARLIVERFKDPILLTGVNRSLFERTLREHAVEICVDTARHDDRALMGALADFGYLNADNIETVIVAVSGLQDAAMSGYLLELKRTRFGRAAFDFDL